MAGTRIIDLTSAQLGTETVWGTNVAPTVIVQGMQEMTITPMTEVSVFESLQGLAPAYDTEITMTGGEASMTGLVLYEDLPYWLNSLIKYDVTNPTGAGPTYTWFWAPDLNTCPTRDSYTLIYGDDQDAYALNGAVVNTMTISGAASEALSMDLEFIGKNVVEDDLDLALITRDVTIATSAQTSVFIDDFGGSFGATPSDCTVFEFELELNSNTDVTRAIGQIDACDFFGTRWEGTLSLTMEFPGDGDITKNILNSYVGVAPTQVEKLIRLEAESGTNKITIDFAGVLTTAPDIFTDTDGVLTLEMEFSGKFTNDFAPGNWLEITVVNDVAALA